MESQTLGYASAIANVHASGCRARVHSNINININIIVNVSLPWLGLLPLLCTPGICRRQDPMPPLRRR
jgi:hypothetical protein